MEPFNKRDRNKYYKEALKSLIRGDYFIYGLCFHINKSIPKEVQVKLGISDRIGVYGSLNEEYGNYEHLPLLFKEVREYMKENNIKPGEYWFPEEEKFKKDRAFLLEKWIKETSPKKKANGTGRISKGKNVSRSRKKSSRK